MNTIKSHSCVFFRILIYRTWAIHHFLPESTAFNQSARCHLVNLNDVIISFDCVLSFPRNERTHPNFVSQAREIEIFCEDCKLAAPLSFFRGFGPRFRAHSLLYACFLLWLLSLFSTLEVFLDLVFHSDYLPQKRECSPIADWSEIFWPRSNKLHHR